MEVDLVGEKLKELSLNEVETIKKQKFNDAIEELHQLEKKYRAAEDAISIGRILVAIVELHFELAKFSELNESILSFTMKKHLQSEHAIGAMIRKCCEYIEVIDDRSVRMKFLETLKTVTDGRLYSEKERAKVCKELASMRKEDNDINNAIKTLEDLRIDTITTLERDEKIEIILQLMDLLIESKEFVKCLIVAKKINKKILDQTPEYEALKIRFYNLMILIDQHENYLNTSRHYQAILTTEKIQSESEESKKFLALAVIFCILAPFDNEKSDMMERLRKHKMLHEIPLYQELLNEFTTIELINWYTMKAKFKDELSSLGIFDVTSQEGLKCWKDLRTATIEHNIKVFATYYQRAFLSHMSEFLDINVDETEKFLCNLIVKKSINAKIDRLTGIVKFNQPHFNATNMKPANCQPNQNILEDWLQQVSSLMGLIDHTTHLINKEESEL